MQRKIRVDDPNLVFRLESSNAPGAQVTPGSHEVRKDLEDVMVVIMGVGLAIVGHGVASVEPGLMNMEPLDAVGGFGATPEKD